MTQRYRCIVTALTIAAALFALPAFSQELTLVGRLDNKHGVSGGVYYSGSWGYVAPDLREYAILTTATGTAIIDITDTSDIREVVHIPGPTSLWREVRTWNDRLYVVTEAGGGTQIIDLSQLPDTATLIKSFTYTAGPKNTGRAHSLEIFDGYLYLNGCAFWGTTAQRGAVIFSLADPDNPAFVGEYSPNYFHDSFVRNDTIFGASIYSDGGIYIADITNKAAPVEIGKITYTGSGTHNVWTTKDGAYVISTDEIGATQKNLKIWDLATLPTVPVAPVATFTHSPVDIGHNVFVRGDYAYTAWYTAGISIADVSDPTSPDTVDSYDTSTMPDGGYDGVWAVYPYFWSGKVIAGDMQNGLYVFTFDSLRPRTPVSLIEPADSTLLSGAPPVTFRWTRASDQDADPVKYFVHIEGGAFDTTVGAGDDTTLVFNGAGSMPAGTVFTWEVITADVANRVPSQESRILEKAGLSVITPTGDDGLKIGETSELTWETVAAGVDIAWSSDGGSSWEAIASVPGTPATYDWTVPSVPTTQGLVRVRDAADSLTADVNDEPFTICAAEIEAEAGWDLVSVPSNPDDFTVGFHFPGAVSAYAYDGGYLTIDSVFPGAGYWIKQASAETLFSVGTPLVLDTIPVAAKWNIVGSLSSPLPAASVVLDPPSMTRGSFYGYTPLSGYYAADTLVPGQGYWVRCSEAGSIVLDTSTAAAAPKTAPVRSGGTGRNVLTLTSGGMARTLEFSGGSIDPAEREMSALPPPPPSGGFDARFAGDYRLAEIAGGSATEILVRGVKGGVEVRLDLAPGEEGDYMIRARNAGGPGTGVTLGSSTVSLDLTDGALVLEAVGASAPRAYRLLQNSPNPFNPTTTIRFELPAESRVKLEVFSVLGEKLATLVDGVRPAGVNESEFRADGLPSGTYFYVLNAGGETLTGKMLLAR